ncbi:MAG: TonB-dependent receptor [bacterium]|nr:TonB-dependent receptor [bacterium]
MKIKFTLILFFALLSASAQNKTSKSNFTFNCIDEDSNVVIDFYSKIIGTDSTNFIPNKTQYDLTIGKSYVLVIQKFGYWESRTSVKLTGQKQTILLKEKLIEQTSFILKATRVDKNNAFAYTNLNAREIAAQNLGQDFTYLIGNTPSAVTTSDAGSGVGYTGIRIRGSDATRINVTINGVPINDAESHGVYWVNMPDLASSTNSVQVQRGVGTSTNGNGSFGANISINNIENSNLPGFQIQQSYGSFNTTKSNLKFSTGRIGNFSFNGRLSKILSDGYIDRASSNLSAFQFNLNYYKNKWAINAVSFGGKEKTYQSWYGTPQSRYEGNDSGMQAYISRNSLTPAQAHNLLNSGRTYNYYTYKNQTDNYWQNHYQLHIGKQFNKINFKSSFFTTTGKGFYEEFKEGASFANYGVNNFISPNADTITTTDLIRQKWLDNIYFGNFTTLDYNGNNLKLNAGIGATSYQGNHFGKVTWASVAQPFGNDQDYYRAKSEKNEVNGFLKGEYTLLKGLKVLAELQMRKIDYSSSGIGSELTEVKFKQHYNFFNPKVGFNYQYNKTNQVYASYSKGNREPVRSDFTDNANKDIPKSEQMADYELGWINKGRTHFVQVNAYNMNYVNQLVLTGAVNDVGNSIRRNADASYRRGIELIGMQSVMKGKLTFEGNLTLSSNKIKSFTDIYYDYGDSGEKYDEVKVIHKNTDISFSPNVIGYFGITDKHIKNLQLGINLKYVGKQYLDNTQNESQKLNSYSTISINFQKEIKIKNAPVIVFRGVVNNLGSINYTNNGYTFKYVLKKEITIENFYYPQSKINFLVGLDIKI